MWQSVDPEIRLRTWKPCSKDHRVYSSSGMGVMLDICKRMHSPDRSGIKVTYRFPEEEPSQPHTVGGRTECSKKSACELSVTVSLGTQQSVWHSAGSIHVYDKSSQRAKKSTRLLLTDATPWLRRTQWNVNNLAALINWSTYCCWTANDTRKRQKQRNRPTGGDH